MPRRRYLDLTPAELLGRRCIAGGVGLATLPPLLLGCHLQRIFCGGVKWNTASVSGVFALFPWTIPLAVLALAGMSIALAGAVLLCLRFPAPPFVRPGSDQPRAFQPEESRS
jgi:hypothetical protein